MKSGSVYVETYIGQIISWSQLSQKMWIQSSAVYLMFARESAYPWTNWTWKYNEQTGESIETTSGGKGWELEKYRDKDMDFFFEF